MPGKLEALAHPEQASTKMVTEQRGQANQAASKLAAQKLQNYGALSLLAVHCPVHSTFSAKLLNALFLPAVEYQSVKVFYSSDGQPFGAVIWARLSDQIAQGMLDNDRPPKASEWSSGKKLWFLDLIAPFGHGKQIARHIARNPPKEAFAFARIGSDRKFKKLVQVGPDGSGLRGISAAGRGAAILT